MPDLLDSYSWLGETQTVGINQFYPVPYAYATTGSGVLNSNLYLTATTNMTFNHPFTIQPPAPTVYASGPVYQSYRGHQVIHRQPGAASDESVQRARELLYEHLDEEQAATYRSDLYFETVGSRGTRYRIEWGYAGNVLALDDEGRPWRRYCCHPSGYVNEDTLLTQKLLLETDEDRFLAVANIDTTPVDCEVVRVGAEA